MLERLGQFFSTGSSHSLYLDLLVGVPQGSILDPFLFSKYMWDLFLCDCESKITVDNATLYYCEPNMDLVLSKIEKDAFSVFTWFQDNNLETNIRKSHFLTTSDNILHIGGINSTQ